MRMGIGGGMPVRRADAPLGGSFHGQGESNGKKCGEQADFVHGFPRGRSSCEIAMILYDIVHGAWGYSHGPPALAPLGVMNSMFFAVGRWNNEQSGDFKFEEGLMCKS